MTDHRRSRFVALTLLVGAGLLLSASGCGPGGVPRMGLSPETVRPNPRVVLFICDGMRADLLEQMVEEGRCPNIQRYLLARGARVENAITCVPSITYAVLTTYVTGCTPAHHGVLANRWFDRVTLIYRDYGTMAHYRDVNADFRQPTIYALIRPRLSLSIQDAVYRGVTRNIANWAQSGVRWFFEDFTAVDKLTSTTLDNVARWANQRGAWPHLLTLYYPGVDAVGHKFGPDSQRYEWSIEHFDHQVGRVCRWLEREGMLDRTTLVLTSDHGHVPIKNGTVDLQAYLREVLGRRVLASHCQDAAFEARRKYLRRFDAVLVPSADRFAMVYFRTGEDWDQRPTCDEVQRTLLAAPEGRRLWELEGVALTARLLSESEVELRSAAGSARIEQRDGPAGPEFRYVGSEGDVLGYLEDPELRAFVDAGFHDSRAWLAATSRQRLPDVVPQLPDLLRAPRAGDVLVFADWGYGFEGEKGGHGGLFRQEMRVPLLLAGPGIAAGASVPTSRAVDVVPTIMDILGCPAAAEGLDGRSLLPQLSKSLVRYAEAGS